MSEDYTDYIFKALAIGDGGCGKTALCIQFAQGFFQENYKLTIGVEFYVKTIKVKNYAVKLQIWDTVQFDLFSGRPGKFQSNYERVLSKRHWGTRLL